jgi:hypothetical protein
LTAQVHHLTNIPELVGVSCCRHLPKAGPLLQVGVGTSRIQADMALDGYTSIHSTDYSPVAIQRLQQLHADNPALTYAVADVRSMPEYADGSYAGVLDKGTLDALLCGDDDTAAAAQMMAEVWRLLQPGASYVMVTSGEWLGQAHDWSSNACHNQARPG